MNKEGKCILVGNSGKSPLKLLMGKVRISCENKGGVNERGGVNSVNPGDTKCLIYYVFSIFVEKTEHPHDEAC